MTNRYDYVQLERLYVQGSMTIRQLALNNGVEPQRISSITAQAKKRDWVSKREEFRAKSLRKSMELGTDTIARRAAREIEVTDHAIEVIDEGLTKMSVEMKATRQVERGGELVEEPLFIMTPERLVGLIDRLQTLFGRPNLITEGRSLGISIAGEASPEQITALAGLAASLREVPSAAGPRRAGGSALPDAPGPRKN